MDFLTVSGIELRENGNQVLQPVSFSQPQFQKLVVAGETGAGKSSLLQIIAGLIQPTGGEARFEGRRLRGPADQLVPGNPGIVYLSQQFELPKFLRVEQVLRYANKLSAEAAEQLYDVCRIRPLLLRQTNQLSGGERQRIALARLLLSAPRLLLLDEPFSNLDMAHKKILKAVIHDISSRLGITCILISHDPLDTLSWADTMLVLQAGRVVQRGTPEEIYRRPVSEYAAALFGSYNLLTGAAAKAFARLAGVKKPEGRLLVRPESFTLTTKKSAGLPGTVAAVRYYGSYSEVDVTLRHHTFTLKTTQPGLASGHAVRVALAPEDVWLIDT